MTRPNFLVIVADDLGYADLSAYGSSVIDTPNLDKLARQGVRFTAGYSANPVCTPNRLAFNTGRIPQREVLGTKGALTLGATAGLEPEVPTVASLLGDSGYRTALFGKWHLGFHPNYGPLLSGWQEFWGNYAGAVDYFSKTTRLGADDLWEGTADSGVELLPSQTDSEEYYTEQIADRGVEFIWREHDSPWLLNLNFNSGHWPWQGPDDKARSAFQTEQATEGRPTQGLGGSRAVFREMVEALDDQIGRVLDALKRSGQDRETLVVFYSDNGGERYSEQGIFQGGKGGLEEGGIRVPTLLRWTGAVEAGQVSDLPVITHDFTATILDLAGVEPDPERPLDGRSLAGHLVDGSAAPTGPLFWRYADNLGLRALRDGKWKYHRNEHGTERLIDLEADPVEERNLAAEHPEKLAELRASWLAIDAELVH